MSRQFVACLLIWLCLGAGEAKAQSATVADQGVAYTRCVSALAAVDRTHVPGSGYYGDPGACVEDVYQDIYGRVTCKITNYNDNGSIRNPSANCPGGVYSWLYLLANKCSARAPMLNVYYRGEGGSCAGGCLFAVDIGAGITNKVIKVGNGGGSVTRVGRMTPTGGTCSLGDGVVAVQEQTEDQCQQQGNLTQCLTADGRTCAVASSGKKFCWEPTESGIKASGNEAATKAPEGTSIKPPPKAPNNGGDWQQGGTGTVSVTTGGVTNNYNTTNWNSSYGNQGSGANGGGADGEGNGGSGDGSGEEGEGDGDGWGEPGAGVGDLYDGTDKTIGGLMGNFWAQINAVPLAQSVTRFMGVGNGGGACPVFTVGATTYWETMTFDAHCSGNWLAVLQAMGWIVFAIACYVAVRIAVT